MSVKARTADLRKASNGRSGTVPGCRNGNHFTVVKPGTAPVIDAEGYCRGCVHNLECVLGGRVISYGQATQENMPCVNGKNHRIEFYYHDTLCLTFNLNTNEVLDHGLWGHSVTTSRAIRWYLGALAEEGHIWPMHVDECAKLSKKNKGGDDKVLMVVP